LKAEVAMHKRSKTLHETKLEEIERRKEAIETHMAATKGRIAELRL
jgi:hypothetical protein